MDSTSPPTGAADDVPEQVSLVTQESPLAPSGSLPMAPRRRRKVPLVVAGILALIVAGVAIAVTDPFAAGAGRSGAGKHADPAGSYTVERVDLSSQTEVPATIGYAGSYSIIAPSGATPREISQDQQAVTEDEQTLSADELYESDKLTADNHAITAAQTIVALADAAASSDETTETQQCAGTAASSAVCSQAEQTVSEDKTQLTQGEQQLAAAQSVATLDHDQDAAKVQSDETRSQGDEATLASLQTTAVNPGTTYTALPTVGEVIKEDQPVYSVSNMPVPLLYGSITAYRAFSIGMSDGADVGELTEDLITLGYGGLTQSNHYSSATASAVEGWQTAIGLPATGEILLGEVVFEPGALRVTSVTPVVGDSVGTSGSGAGTNGSGGSDAGGGSTVLMATSTARQVSIALDASDQSEVAVGDKVSIALPNNAATPGVVSSVGTVATQPSSSSTSGSGSSSPTITVLVDPTDPAATGSWDQAPVNVTITTGTVTNTMVVPVDALLARTGGGYAVEVVGVDGLRSLVSVTLGLFDDADGLVQVTGSSLTAGQKVVVPNL